MNLSDPTLMAEATRLTRAGRLTEATALIQRALGNPQTPPSPSPSAGSDQAGPGRASAPALTQALPKVCRARTPRSREHTGTWSPTTLPVNISAHLPVDLPRTGPGGTAQATRPYRLHVPTNLPSGPVPLVVLLHGGTQDAATFAAATGFDELADRHGFVAAYPEQVPAANAMRYWNWFSPADQRRGSGEPKIIADIVAEIAAAHPVDPGRVYVVGFSAGAAMASVLAATYPDVFAGLGVHSGLAYAVAHDVPSAFAAMNTAPAAPPAATSRPVIVFHGDADPTVKVTNARTVLAQFVPASAATSTTRGHEGGREYTRAVATDGDGVAIGEQWIVHGGGHAWSGGRPGGSYTDPSGPSASAQMARFFGLT